MKLVTLTIGWILSLAAITANESVLISSRVHHSNTFAFDKSKPSVLEDGNYVVVGAFTFQKNAVNYAKFVSNKGYNANYGLVDNSNYYYVYLYYSRNWDEAVEQTYQVREDMDFQEAWVMCIGDNMIISKPEEKDIPEKTIETIELIEESNEEVSNEFIPDNTSEEDVKEELPTDDETKTTEQPDSIYVNKDEINGDYYILPTVTRLKDQNRVEATIEVVDDVRAKLVKRINSNEVSGIYDPRNNKHTIQLICGLFGYRKIEHHINLETPVNDSTKAFVRLNDDEVIRVRFELERLRQGDIAVMYNVYYFNDAAIMRPESKYEINSLLEMLHENPEMKIMIHGHTNGNKPGRIIQLNEDQDDYFSLGRDNPDGFGSAKELSSLRGETIKKFLVDNGIAANRMQVKGWGGKKMLYDKDSPQAKKNIRVEIEILKD